MIALDTNILVYARREEAVHHLRAHALLFDLATGPETWAIPWPCIYEFLRVVTHPRVFDPPTRLEHALEDLESLFACPTLVLLGEGPAHGAHLLAAARGGTARGNLAHDAHIAALIVEHGVREFLTTDRDFGRFPGVRVRNPFAPDGLLREPRAGYSRKRDSRQRA